MTRTQGQVMVRAIQLGVIAVVVLIWYVVSVRGAVPVLLVPKLNEVILRLGKIVSDPQAYYHIRITLGEFVIAMGFSLITGLLIGLLMGASRYLGELFEPLILAAYAVPIIMIYPLCILFFGIGQSSKIAFAAVYCFFPIAIQTMKGVKYIDRQLVKAAVSMGASRTQLIFKVIFPAAFPMILTGLRLAAVLSWLSIVAGEMIASVEGIGYEIAQASGLLDSTGLYAWIIIVIFFVALVTGTLAWLERRFQVT